VKLVELTQPDGADVVAAVGPLQDGDAEAYATELRRLVDAQAGAGLSVTTKVVESTSGEATGTPVPPADLVRKALSRSTEG
jgi:hypothetical protein